MFYLAKKEGKNLDMFLLRKGNRIMIAEFRYGQNWKIWQFPLYHFTVPLKVMSATFLYNTKRNPLLKVYEILFIEPKKLFSFLSYSNFVVFIFLLFSFLMFFYDILICIN